MNRLIVYTFKNHFWEVARAVIYNNNTIEKVYRINKFWELKEDKLIIYDTGGGTGIGWKKSDVLHIIKLDNFDVISVVEADKKIEDKINDVYYSMEGV